MHFRLVQAVAADLVNPDRPASYAGIDGLRLGSNYMKVIPINRITIIV